MKISHLSLFMTAPHTMCSLSDPFAVLYTATDDGLREVGRTEVVPNNLSNGLESRREKSA